MSEPLTAQGTAYSRRAFLLMAALGAATACSPVTPKQQTEEQGNDGKPVELSFWKPPGQEPKAENAYFDDLSASFASSHNNDKVKHLLLPWNDALTKYTAAFGGGTAPDLSYLVLLWLNQFSSAGALAALNDVDANLDLTGFQKNAIDSAKGKDGKLYGMPYYSSRWVLALNEKIWEKAGKPALPKTYEDLGEFAKKLTFDRSGNTVGDTGFDKANIATYGLAWPGLYEIETNYLWNYLWAYGADYVSGDGKDVGFDNAGGREALTLMRKIQESGAATPTTLYSDPLKWGEVLLTGRAGVQWIAPPTAETFKKHPDARLKVLDLPSGPSGKFVVGGVGYLCISAKTKYPETALDFIKFATSDDNVSKYLQQTLLFPVRDTISADVYAPLTDSKSKKFLTDSLPQGEFMRLTRPLPYNAEQYLAGEINNYVSGQKDLDKMIKDASKQIHTMAKNAGM